MRPSVTLSASEPSQRSNRGEPSLHTVPRSVDKLMTRWCVRVTHLLCLPSHILCTAALWSGRYVYVLCLCQGVPKQNIWDTPHPSTSPQPSPTQDSLTTALTHPSLLPPHHSPHPPISPAAQGQNQLGRYHLDGELKVKSDDERESRKKWVCCVRWCVLVSCPTIAGLPHGTSVVQSQRGGADQWVGVG